MKLRVAISACLLGESCRYDGKDNRNEKLIELLDDYLLIPFCPEGYCYGTPRPTMDIVLQSNGEEKAISNETGCDLTLPLERYADDFFSQYEDISLFIGKDRSPSCGVVSAKLYDTDKNLISSSATGVMAKASLNRAIESWDAQSYLEEHSCIP